eukprot:COSAG02_NODE_62637_length_265_cov_0.867470_1_plen_68_part_10
MSKAWDWLTAVALHEDGRVGNCQPGGGQPENNFGSNSTSDFCVGQFLLASSRLVVEIWRSKRPPDQTL